VSGLASDYATNHNLSEVFLRIAQIGPAVFFFFLIGPGGHETEPGRLATGSWLPASE